MLSRLPTNPLYSGYQDEAEKTVSYSHFPPHVETMDSQIGESSGLAGQTRSAGAHRSADSSELERFATLLSSLQKVLAKNWKSRYPLARIWNPGAREYASPY